MLNSSTALPTNSSTKNSAPSFFEKALGLIWKHICQPHPSIVNPQDKQKASFLAFFFLLSAPLPLLFSLMAPLSGSVHLHLSVFQGSLLSLFALSQYGLCRTRFFQQALPGFIIAGLIIPFTTSLVFPHSLFVHTFFLFPVLLVASLSSMKALFLTAGITWIALGVLWAYLPEQQEVFFLSNLLLFFPNLPLGCGDQISKNRTISLFPADSSAP